LTEGKKRELIHELGKLFDDRSRWLFIIEAKPGHELGVFSNQPREAIRRLCRDLLARKEAKPPSSRMKVRSFGPRRSRPRGARVASKLSQNSRIKADLGQAS